MSSRKDGIVGTRDKRLNLPLGGGIFTTDGDNEVTTINPPNILRIHYLFFNTRYDAYVGWKFNGTLCLFGYYKAGSTIAKDWGPNHFWDGLSGVDSELILYIGAAPSIEVSYTIGVELVTPDSD